MKLGLIIGLGLILATLVIFGFVILNAISAAEADAAYRACVAGYGIYGTNDTGEMVAIAEMCSE